jgi:hypothetical protein
MPYPFAAPGPAPQGISSLYSVGGDGTRTLQTNTGTPGSPMRDVLMELARRYMSGMQSGGGQAGGGASRGSNIFGRNSYSTRSPSYNHARENSRAMANRADEMDAYNAYREGFLDQYDDAPETRYGGSFGSPSTISPLQLGSMPMGSGGSGGRAPSTPAGEAAAAITALAPKPPAPAAPEAASATPAASPAPAAPAAPAATGAPAGGGAAPAGTAAAATQGYDEFVGASPEELAQFEVARRLKQRQGSQAGMA